MSAVIEFTIKFDDILIINGNPELEFSPGIGSVTSNAIYQSGTGTDTITFGYTVQPGDIASLVDVTAFDLKTATIEDKAGNLADLTIIPGSLSSKKYFHRYYSAICFEH